ncbi:Na/Pi symporter [Bacillus carboniphilus]|uniref:Na/Pi symporter n=1 Tax=Bacillus carboniphilus TaxID=86663 RepID=A0ABN0WL94_9BACI
MLYLLLFVFLIGVFIAGMFLMRSGLYSLTGENLKEWLYRLTNRPIKGMIASILVTGVLQSSSAVMVLTVGLVSAGALAFPQTIGIILGTNIGTTFTAEFMTFPLDEYVVYFMIIGAFLIVLTRGKLRATGVIFLGIGMIFTAMRGFKWIADPLSSLEFVHQGFLMMNDSIAISVLIGIIFTALIQSSSATTGILMSFLMAGTIGLESGIAAMLGANIGTCVTGWMASIGARKEAKLTAYAHIWLNVVGVFVFLPFVTYLADIVQSWSTSPAVQLAHASVVFNVFSSLLVLPFASQFGHFIEKVHGR